MKHISNILRRMLSLSRPATAEYKWVDVNELIDNTLLLMKFDKRMRLVTINNITAADLPMVWLNPQLLEQVLIKIFINALDVMKPVISEDILTKIRQHLQYLGLQEENQELKRELNSRFGIGHIVGQAASMQQVFKIIRKVARTKSNVLLVEHFIKKYNAEMGRQCVGVNDHGID